MNNNSNDNKDFIIINDTHKLSQLDDSIVEN